VHLQETPAVRFFSRAPEDFQFCPDFPKIAAVEKNMDSCFNCDIPQKRGPRQGKFYVEGHRSKTGWEDESTLIVPAEQGYDTLEEATAKARGYFEARSELGLAVIFQQDAEGTKEGLKFIFRNDEGGLEESDLLY
jgi:hypothetical protein